MKTELFSPAAQNRGDRKIITHRLIVDDNQSVLPMLLRRGERFDVVYMDPPYNGYVWRNGEMVPEIEDEIWLSRIRQLIGMIHSLLADSGLLFISINDREAAHCRIICDEIFGKQNFMAQIVRRRTDHPLHAKVFSREHEYIITFARNAKRIHETWNRPPISTWWDSAGTDEDAALEVKEQLGDLVFDYPKPSALIESCITICQNKAARVLDVFAGSGTTAVAVEHANQKDNGSRSYTLIQRDELYQDANIAEICCRRVQRTLADSTIAQRCIVCRGTAEETCVDHSDEQTQGAS